MALRVVGVGLGRTGTHSLKIALEQLLGAPCHHMLEVVEHPDQIPLWTAAAQGSPDWPTIFHGYAATVDWPGAAFWRQLIDEYPDAVVLLSRRASADEWWRSADRTIFATRTAEMAPPPPVAEWFDTVFSLLADAGFDPKDEAATKAAYESHNNAVRAAVPAERLVDWSPGDGWKPICDALDLAVPEAPFPHVNTTDEFRAMFGLTP